MKRYWFPIASLALHCSQGADSPPLTLFYLIDKSLECTTSNLFSYCTGNVKVAMACHLIGFSQSIRASETDICITPSCSKRLVIQEVRLRQDHHSI